MMSRVIGDRHGTWVELRGLEPLAEQGKRALHLRRCSDPSRSVTIRYQRFPAEVLTASTRQALRLRPDKAEPASTSPQRCGDSRLGASVLAVWQAVTDSIPVPRTTFDL